MSSVILFIKFATTSVYLLLITVCIHSQNNTVYPNRQKDTIKHTDTGRNIRDKMTLPLPGYRGRIILTSLCAFKSSCQVLLAVSTLCKTPRPFIQGIVPIRQHKLQLLIGIRSRMGFRISLHAVIYTDLFISLK